MAVPDENFPGFLKFYKDTLDASGIDYVIFGHIGDCHLHANLLPKDDEEAERARHIYGRFVAQAIMLGGCVSAEHGIGKLKTKISERDDGRTISERNGRAETGIRSERNSRAAGICSVQSSSFSFA